jgi:small subunit ribosomal protein S18
MNDDKMMASAMRGDKDSTPETGGKFRGKRRRKVSYLTVNKIDTVDYKDVAVLRRFINDRGKMLPSRQTGNTAKQQRMVARAIRRARELALLPFVVTEMVPDRREREYTPRHRDRAAAAAQAQEAAAKETATEATATAETPAAE